MAEFEDRPGSCARPGPTARSNAGAGQADDVVREMKSGHLPPLTYRELPEALPLRKVVGPGVIILAGSMGAGEFVLWPYMASQVGFTFLWAAVLGLGTQYLINMEVARYTLATGETAVTGFTRLWRPWWWLFILMAMVQVAWPGWATGAATTLSFALGGGDVTLFATLSLPLSALLLTISPVVYQFMEKFGFIKVVLMIAFLVAATTTVTGAADWAALAKTAPASVGAIPEVPGMGVAALFAAVALAGSGGFANGSEAGLRWRSSSDPSGSGRLTCRSTGSCPPGRPRSGWHCSRRSSWSPRSCCPMSG